MNDDELCNYLRRPAAIVVDNAAADRIGSLLAEVAGLRAERGRVPVSWDECADWLDAFGPGSVQFDNSGSWEPTGYSAEQFREPDTMHWATLGLYRLLPPPNLVAAPSGMDGGGFLGAGADVPDGWEWRGFTADTFTPDRANEPDALVQCRPPVKPAERAVVEVPLTQLVGRVIEGETEAVDRFEGYPEGVLWFPHGGSARDLTVSNDLVRVYAEGDA